MAAGVRPPPLNGQTSWLASWLPSWRPTSEQQLISAEKIILDGLTSSYEDIHVPIAPDAVIRTLVMEAKTASELERVPLVMVPGFGCGLPQFYKNFDHLHNNRKLYAFDLPGFGRSTRMNFSPDAAKAEEEFVDAIEKWRQEMGLDKFILLGHSLGAFLGTAYAMKHPSHVRHLVLVDPWGFPVKPEERDRERDGGREQRPPFYIRAAAAMTTKFNPLMPVRAAGPIGPLLVRRFRPDLSAIFGADFMHYVYHCNAQKPSGETAFYYLQIPIGWARRPMLQRVGDELDGSVPMTIIHGTRSWMDNCTGDRVKELRPKSYVDLHQVKRAGHHIHAHQPEKFNEIILEVCAKVDANEDCPPADGPSSSPPFSTIVEESENSV